ncbi:MAG: hypothetical protein Q9M94_04450, partial [Candidatus Gracilibacteria bacterium]|nr:hypothetical protein [Candidatus Gracilibacteria bacterium]
NISDEVRDDFIDENIGEELKVLIEVVTQPQPLPSKEGSSNLKWKGWTQNYIEANESNFKIISGKIGKNEIVIGKLIK